MAKNSYIKQMLIDMLIILEELEKKGYNIGTMHISPDLHIVIDDKLLDGDYDIVFYEEEEPKVKSKKYS